jgi:MFS family permease
MLRNVAAVVAGYVSIVVFVMITFSLAWLAMGPSLAFREGTTEVTEAWIAVVMPLNLIGAAIGGWIARRIGRGNGAVAGLAVFIVVLGLALAVVNMNATREPLARPVTELATFEAASYAIQPTWYEFVVPFVGAIGVLLGGRMRRGPQPVPAT